MSTLQFDTRRFTDSPIATPPFGAFAVAFWRLCTSTVSTSSRTLSSAFRCIVDAGGVGRHHHFRYGFLDSLVLQMSFTAASIPYGALARTWWVVDAGGVEQADVDAPWAAAWQNKFLEPIVHRVKYRAQGQATNLVASSMLEE